MAVLAVLWQSQVPGHSPRTGQGCRHAESRQVSRLVQCQGLLFSSHVVLSVLLLSHVEHGLTRFTSPGIKTRRFRSPDTEQFITSGHSYFQAGFGSRSKELENKPFQFCSPYRGRGTCLICGCGAEEVLDATKSSDLVVSNKTLFIKSTF